MTLARLIPVVKQERSLMPVVKTSAVEAVA
jgi:hypothetical protein